MYWHLLWLLLLPLAVTTHALEAYPESRLQAEKRSDVAAYRLVLSGLKRNRAATQAEYEVSVSGTLHRRVWALPEYVSIEDVADYFKAQTEGGDVLYECQGMDCGSSAFWANEIFSNSRLTGRDQQQFYRVSNVTDAREINQVSILYIVQRGTRQIMVNLDQLTTTDGVTVEQSLSQQVKTALESSHGWLPGFVAQGQAVDVQESAALINTLSNLSPVLKDRLHLVVQCYEFSHMADNIRCSEALASELRALTAVGNSSLNISGQGALTPSPHDGLKPALRFVFWPER